MEAVRGHVGKVSVACRGDPGEFEVLCEFLKDHREGVRVEFRSLDYFSLTFLPHPLDLQETVSEGLFVEGKVARTLDLGKGAFRDLTE